MGNIKQAIKQLHEPDKSIGNLLIEFYEQMKELETDPERGGKQAVAIVMAIDDFKRIINNQTDPLAGMLIRVKEIIDNYNSLKY